MVLIWLIYATLGRIFAVSLRRPIGALVEARRQHANLRRELRALGTGEADPAPAHLSQTLARILYR